MASWSNVEEIEINRLRDEVDRLKRGVLTADRLKYEAATATIARLVEALREIANEGRCVSAIAPSPCRPSKPRRQWCWCCVAQDAIETVEVR